MTGNITSLDEFKQSKEPHYQGPAKCSGCDHEFQAVCPIPPPDYFECIACGEFKASYTASFLPQDDDIVFRCRCGNCRMFILKDCVFCGDCGRQHDRDVVNDYD